MSGYTTLCSLLGNQLSSRLVVGNVEGALVKEARNLGTSDDKPALISFLTKLRDENGRLLDSIKSFTSRRRSHRNSHREDVELPSEEELTEFRREVADRLTAAVCLYEINSRLSYFSEEYTNLSRGYLASEAYTTLLACLNLISNSLITADDTDIVDKLFEIIRLTLSVCLRCVPFPRAQSGEMHESDIIDLLVSRLAASELARENNVLVSTLSCALNIPEHEKWSKLGVHNDLTTALQRQSVNSESENVESLADQEVDDDNGYEADDEASYDGIDFTAIRIVHPKVCNAILEVLSEVLEESENELDANVMKIVENCAYTIASFCFDKSNAIVLQESGTSLCILKKFKKLLLSTDENVEIIQKALLDLFLKISSYSIDSEELRAFYELFKANSAPWSLLLNTLHKLITECEDVNHPLHYLTFPAEPLLTSQILHSLSDSNKSWKWWLESFASEPEREAWAEAALLVPISKKTSPFMNSSKSLTASFWFAMSTQSLSLKQAASPATEGGKFINDKRKRDGLSEIHVFTVALGQLTFETWICADQRRFILRLTDASFKNRTVIEQFRSEFRVAPTDNWHHLIVSVNILGGDVKHNANNIIFLLSVDGREPEGSQFQIKQTFTQKIDSPYGLLLGSTKSSSEVTKISNFLLFEGVLSDTHRALLYFMGFEFNNFTECQLDDEKQYYHLLPRFAAAHGSLLPLFLKADLKDNIRELRNNLIINYWCDENDTLLTYEQIEPTASTFRILSRTFATPKVAADCTPSEVIKLGSLNYIHSKGVRRAIAELGGISSQIFLFGKVVDNVQENGELQALALDSLLHACEMHRQFKETLIQINGLAMINAVLESNKCTPCENILHTYLKCVLTSSTYHEALIRSPTEFAYFYAAWRAWHRVETPSLVYQVINDLLSPDNKWCETNLYQMRQANILESVLNMLQVAFIQGEGNLPNFTTHDAEIVAQAIRLLIGSPPDILSLAKLIDCLLLLHQWSKSFVCFAKSSMYFLFPASIDLPAVEASEAIITAYGSPTDDWTVISSETDHVEKHEMHAVLSSTLIHLYTETLLKMVPETRHRWMGTLIRLEYYLVWANSDCSLIREAAVQELFKVLSASTRDVIQDFISKYGFHLLANQLRSYDATESMFHLILSFILNCDVANINLEDIQASRDWTHFSLLQESAFIPLFAVILSSVKNTQLCHNQLVVLNCILDQIPFASPVLKFLFDNGIAECLANVLIESELARTGSLTSEDYAYSEDLIYEDVTTVLSTLGFSLFNSAGGIFFEAYNDLIDLFIALKMSTSGRLAALFQECIVVVMQAGLECIVKHANEARKGVPKRFLNLLTGRYVGRPIDVNELTHLRLPRCQPYGIGINEPHYVQRQLLIQR